ncbi:hypothetical protein AURDEDRAFT_159353 [Auricularia subglabra TFB-10046 SS5]|nr:hypothetical protein AURDEDRAFT_159353 [Auricularia subglabra TFB-10046 SS5]
MDDSSGAPRVVLLVVPHTALAHGTIPEWMGCIENPVQSGEVVPTLTQLRPTANATEQDPIEMLLRVASVLEFLHSKTCQKKDLIVHGNLNIACISVHSDTVIISGFEHCGPDPVSAQSSSRLHYAPPGHLPSMAPELVQSEMRTTWTDVYAFGMLIFRMYAGKYPFDEVDPRDLCRVSAMVRLGGGKRPRREEIQHPAFTDELWELMTECWAQEPVARPRMATVRARLARMV